MTTHTLELPDVDLVYDVHGPLPIADGRPPLVMIGQPMDASGFNALVKHFPDRTVICYDPRGLGRSTRKDGRVENEPAVQASDLHALITALGAGPIEMFASSGGAATALALVAKHPDDVEQAPGWTVTTDIDQHGTHTAAFTTPTGARHRSKAPPLPGRFRKSASEVETDLAYDIGWITAA